MKREGDLLHRWRSRPAALEQLLANSQPPVDLYEFRHAHELYLLYLHSFLDLTNELDGRVQERWQTGLD